MPLPSSPPRSHGEGSGVGRSEAEPRSSNLPRLEIDPRIDPSVGEVGEEIHDQADKGKDIERAKHNGIVTLDQRIVGEIAEPIERKYLFDQQRAREKGADEGAGKTRDDD